MRRVALWTCAVLSVIIPGSALATPPVNPLPPVQVQPIDRGVAGRAAAELPGARIQLNAPKLVAFTRVNSAAKARADKNAAALRAAAERAHFDTKTFLTTSDAYALAPAGPQRDALLAKLRGFEGPIANVVTSAGLDVNVQRQGFAGDASLEFFISQASKLNSGIGGEEKRAILAATLEKEKRRLQELARSAGSFPIASTSGHATADGQSGRFSTDSHSDVLGDSDDEAFLGFSLHVGPGITHVKVRANARAKWDVTASTVFGFANAEALFSVYALDGKTPLCGQTQSLLHEVVSGIGVSSGSANGDLVLECEFDRPNPSETSDYTLVTQAKTWEKTASGSAHAVLSGQVLSIVGQVSGGPGDPSH
jgi:hypothetical protein